MRLWFMTRWAESCSVDKGTRRRLGVFDVKLCTVVSVIFYSNPYVCIFTLSFSTQISACPLLTTLLLNVIRSMLKNLSVNLPIFKTVLLSKSRSMISNTSECEVSRCGTMRRWFFLKDMGKWMRSDKEWKEKEKKERKNEKPIFMYAPLPLYPVLLPLL